MDLPRLIDALSDPAAFSAVGQAVEVRQTHISVVFLVGHEVYKIKKPVKLGFLDFSTLDKRRHYCEEEVRLNARLAPDVYLGVLPIVEHEGRLQVDAAGEPIEWAVRMRRLPDEATLESRLEHGSVKPNQIAELARGIASFHAAAERSAKIAAFGRLEVVAANARGNFEQSRGQIGETISAAVFERLRDRTETALAELAPLIESRAARGAACDTHGDLRIDHVYFLDEAPSAASTRIIDCIEFNEAFRYADPIADVAFLVMDLKYVGEHALASTLTDAYFAAAQDDEGRPLLSFYVAYRAAVRGKVEGLKQAELEVSLDDREEARRRARGYWLLSLGELEPPERRPGLVLIGGLPGSGKSTLAAELAQRACFELLRTDLVRKQLAGKDQSTSEPQAFGSGLYTAAWNERTYAEALRRAEALLFEGRRVIVDASFREDARRQAFIEAASRWKVPVVLLQCEAVPQVIRERLMARRGDASDADWTIYQAAAKTWEPPGERSGAVTHVVDSGHSREQSLDAALECLRQAGLAD